MKQYLLIDIGGTFIKYSLADEQARKISGGKVPTPLTNMDDLLAAIEGFAAPLQGQFVGCAISMPGRIDTRNGIAHTGGMLSAFMWEQPFAAQVEARLGVPVTIANDGKCAAAAEGWTGALAGVENGLVLALGTGIASIQGREEDNFGMVAMCSVGPILAVMVLGICFQSTDVAYTPFHIPTVLDSQDAGREFLNGLPAYMEEVALGLLPIVVFFALFQMISIRLKKRAVIKIIVGMVYTYIGLVLFLTGVNVGFMPAGYFLGGALGSLPVYWLLVPIGMVVGYFIVAAEPAVHVLNKQVEEVTSGAIPQKAIGLALSIGVSVSIGLAMLRVCLGIPIYFLLVPGYAIALILMFFVPKIFTGIAFDSGGVASGPMTATFLLPLTMGACEALGRDVLTDAFGVVSMVAMTPLITIQLLGLFYQWKVRRTTDVTPAEEREIQLVDGIIDYDEEVEA